MDIAVVISERGNINQIMSSWTFSSGGVFVRNDRISSALRAPRKTHVAHVPLINAFPRPEGAQFRVSTGRNTWYAKP